MKNGEGNEREMPMKMKLNNSRRWLARMAEIEGDGGVTSGREFGESFAAARQKLAEGQAKRSVGASKLALRSRRAKPAKRQKAG